MTYYSHSVSTAGAVAALVVATAPDAVPQSADLLWRTVGGRPLISWPLQALTQCDDVTGCSILTMPGSERACRELVFGWPASERLSISASSRGQRIWLNILENGRTPADWLIVVDATLPLLTPESLRAGLDAAKRTGVAMAGEPVKETLKRVDGAVVMETLPRDALRRLFIPVIFHRDALQRALEAYDPSRDDANDLVALTRLAGVPITVFDAAYPAVRVTSEDDLAIVETLLRQRELEASSS